MRAVYCWASALIVVLLSAAAAFAVVIVSAQDDDSSAIESCGIEANRLPPLFVPERYDLTLNLTNSSETLSFSGRVSIRVKYTDILPRSHKITFKELLKKICKRVIACGLDKLKNFQKRQILLNVGRTLEVDSVQVFRASAAAPDDSSSSSSSASSSSSSTITSGKEEQDSLELDGICIDRANQLMAITLARKLAKDDEITIRVEYRARVSSDGKSRGFYQSFNRGTEKQHKDNDDDNDNDVDNDENSVAFTESVSANTHFFPADARTTFPCFDQPDLKAVFSLKLIHDAELTAISNAAPASSKLLVEAADGGRRDADEASENLRTVREVQFADTPRISSYLFAFAVGQYETLTCQAEGKTRPLVTAYAPPGRASEAKFTLETVCRAIPLIENYLMRDFPLAKLDLVSTRQMPEPARENWAMLVFTENFLLTDADTTLVVREEIAKLATHVLLHTYLGNLVSASWWDDQWIFDGLAIWRSHSLADELYPEFSLDFNYLLRLQSPTLDAHASGGAHPIKTHQDLSANEELELFDSSTYNKAAALFQMTNAMLGHFVMRDSLVKFINDHEHSSASEEDLVDAIAKINFGLNQTRYFQSWLDQAGVPLVSVTIVGEELELSQERLLNGPITWEPSRPSVAADASTIASGGSHKARKAEPLWDIPIDIIFSDGNNMLETVHTSLREAKKRVHGPRWFNHLNKQHWFKLNAKFKSLYRVSYAPNALARLQAPIRTQALSPQDRFNVIDDLRALYSLGKLSASDLMQALDWFENERHGGVLSGLALVLDEMSSRESPARVDALAHKLFGDIYEQFRYKVEEAGSLRENHADLLGLQDTLIQLIKHNHEPAIEEAIQVFEAEDVHLEPYLRKPVYLAVIKRGSHAQINELLLRLESTRSDFERSILVNYLSQFVNEETNSELKERLAETLSA